MCTFYERSQTIKRISVSDGGAIKTQINSPSSMLRPFIPSPGANSVRSIGLRHRHRLAIVSASTRCASILIRPSSSQFSIDRASSERSRTCPFLGFSSPLTVSWSEQTYVYDGHESIHQSDALCAVRAPVVSIDTTCRRHTRNIVPWARATFSHQAPSLHIKFSWLTAFFNSTTGPSVLLILSCVSRGPSHVSSQTCYF